jgi:hypothetical protein
MPRSGNQEGGGSRTAVFVAEIEGLYRVIPLQEFRKTPGVSFDILPGRLVPRVDAIDRVLHEGGAVSPGPVGEVARPWYCHQRQDDNLLVLAGVRHVDIYTKRHGRMESFDVYHDRIERDGKIWYEGPAMLVWPCGVFHRIRSGADGSASVNLATHYEGWSIKDNFDVFDLDPATGEARVIREGWRDQRPDAGE